MARVPKLTGLILERLEALKEASADLLYLAEPFVPYREKVKQIFPKYASLDSKFFKNKSRFYSFMHYLQKQGLIEKKKKDNRLFWTITPSGKIRLKEIKNENEFLPPKINYKTNSEKNFKLIIFDIPEKYKRKREWLREQLILLNFTLLQKSVWIGKNKLPEDFIKNLNELKLLPYIHIFTVKDEGTITFSWG